MSGISRVLLFMVSCVFTQNFVFTKLLADSALLRRAGRLASAAAVGLFAIVVMAFGAAVNWLVLHLVLIPLNAQSLYLIAFVLAILAASACAGAALKKLCPPMGDALDGDLPLLGAACAMLGASVMGMELSFGWAILNGLFGGLGLLLALVLMEGVQERLEFSNIPEPLKGFPISLISASLIALAFMGFAGMGG